MSYRLGINTGFAVNRYPEPEDWSFLVGEILGLRYLQFTADLLNPNLPDKILDDYIERTNQACKYYNVNISSTFTGAFTRVNHLAHPDSRVRNYWVEWFKRYVDISVALGAVSMGSHFGIFSANDNQDPKKREERREQNIELWHEIGKYAVKKGLKFLAWEPMSISREQGETLAECQRLQEDVNKASPIPFKLCLDVDHGDLSSSNPDDTDPYVWIKTFGRDSPLIHLKQTIDDKGGHWPFTEEFNKKGKIIPKKLLFTLESIKVDNVDLILELSFREREPFDSQVISVLKESVAFWREYVFE